MPTSPVLAPERQPAQPQEKDEDPPTETDEERQQREHTDRSNRDNYATEGNVVEVNLTAGRPYVVIGMRDGLQTIFLLCGDQCPTIRVGDYVEAEGEKVNEPRFEATEVTVSRPR